MTNSDLMGFLTIGLILVVADGQVLYRGGRRYLRGSDGSEGTGSMVWMVVTIFHIVSIGVLALLAVVGPGWSGSPAALVGRIGIFLLLMAVAHGLTLSVLSRQREDRVVEAHYRDRDLDRGAADQPGRSFVDDTTRPGATDASWQPIVTPVPGQPGLAPQVSPDLGQHGPYRA